MGRRLVVAIAMLAPTVARAGTPSEDITAGIAKLLYAHDGKTAEPPPEYTLKFQFSSSSWHADSKPEVAQFNRYTTHKKLKPVFAFAGANTGWVAMDVQIMLECVEHEGAPPPLVKCPTDPRDRATDESGRDGMLTGVLHVTCLFERGKVWEPRVCHFGDSYLPANEPKAAAKGFTLPAIQGDGVGVAKAAEPVVALFKSTLADPKAFAKTVADRVDVVLYGSNDGERYVGGAQVRKQLDAWSLALSVRDGIAAGTNASKTVAWVAANVDASSTKVKFKRPYRLLAIYERTGNTWRVVQLNFSLPT